MAFPFQIPNFPYNGFEKVQRGWDPALERCGECVVMRLIAILIFTTFEYPDCHDVKKVVFDAPDQQLVDYPKEWGSKDDGNPMTDGKLV